MEPITGLLIGLSLITGMFILYLYTTKDIDNKPDDTDGGWG